MKLISKVLDWSFSFNTQDGGELVGGPVAADAEAGVALTFGGRDDSTGEEAFANSMR